MIEKSHTIKELLLSYLPQFSGISERPELEIELLLAHAIGKEKEFLIKNPNYNLTETEFTNFEILVNRRLQDEPFAYITGEKEFYGLKFFVDKSVLIPRPETELLVERTLETILRLKDVDLSPSTGSGQTLSKGDIAKVAELATGSGAIIISLAHELKKKGIENIELKASDISEEALGVAKRNAESILGKDHMIKFENQDILEIESIDVDILISNPPYIPTEEMETLEKNVKEFEPKIALDGGADGMDFYKKIFEILKSSPTRFALLEIHSTKVRELIELKEKMKLPCEMEIIKDLSGKDRIISLRKI